MGWDMEEEREAGVGGDADGDGAEPGVADQRGAYQGGEPGGGELGMPRSAGRSWAKYMQLTEAEAFFRALKSELWVTLKHLLKRRPAIIPQPSASGVDNAQPISPMKALALRPTPQTADIVLPTTDGRESRLRRITEPTAEQKSLLQQLGLSLPERLDFRPKM
jgi:hypothetical protein